MKRLLLITVLLAVLLSAGCGSFLKTQYIIISAGRLHSDYEADEVAADQQYKGKTLQLTGVISSMGTDTLGAPYIVLNDSGVAKSWGVQCTFSKAYAAVVAQLSVGQTTTLTGKCKGYFNASIVLVEVK